MTQETKIDRTRITALLRDQGFRPALPFLGDPAWVRLFPTSPLSLWLFVTSAGVHGEAVVPKAGAGVTQILPFGIEREPIQTVAEFDDIQRGYTFLKTVEAARDWEKKFARAGPDAADRIARQRGPEIQARTKAARAAVQNYLQHVDGNRPPELLWEELRTMSNPRQLAEAERLSRWPGVQLVTRAERVYELACLCVVLFASLVEPGGTTFFGRDPLSELPLMWRIQLLADAVMVKQLPGST